MQVKLFTSIYTHCQAHEFSGKIIGASCCYYPKWRWWSDDWHLLSTFSCTLFSYHVASQHDDWVFPSLMETWQELRTQILHNSVPRLWSDDSCTYHKGTTMLKHTQWRLSKIHVSIVVLKGYTMRVILANLGIASPPHFQHWFKLPEGRTWKNRGRKGKWQRLMHESEFHFFVFLYYAYRFRVSSSYIVFLVSFKNFGSISPQKAMSVSIVYTSKVLVSTS